MEEVSSLKRQREETQEEEVLKRQKSYKEIINLLEEEEDEPNEDLSSLISTLQEEISSSGLDPVNEPVQSGSYETDPDNQSSAGSGTGEEVMRHLLEASDDELGIPNTAGYGSTEMDGFDSLVGGQVDGGDLFFPVGGGGLWEFEDHEAANYYNLLQADIFM